MNILNARIEWSPSYLSNVSQPRCRHRCMVNGLRVTNNAIPHLGAGALRWRLSQLGFRAVQVTGSRPQVAIRNAIANVGASDTGGPDSLRAAWAEAREALVPVTREEAARGNRGDTKGVGRDTGLGSGSESGPGSGSGSGSGLSDSSERGSMVAGVQTASLPSPPPPKSPVPGWAAGTIWLVLLGVAVIASPWLHSLMNAEEIEKEKEKERKLVKLQRVMDGTEEGGVGEEKLRELRVMARAVMGEGVGREGRGEEEERLGDGRTGGGDGKMVDELMEEEMGKRKILARFKEELAIRKEELKQVEEAEMRKTAEITEPAKVEETKETAEREGGSGRYEYLAEAAQFQKDFWENRRSRNTEGGGNQEAEVGEGEGGRSLDDVADLLRVAASMDKDRNPAAKILETFRTNNEAAAGEEDGRVEVEGEEEELTRVREEAGLVEEQIERERSERKEIERELEMVRQERLDVGVGGGGGGGSPGGIDEGAPGGLPEKVTGDTEDGNVTGGGKGGSVTGGGKVSGAVRSKRRKPAKLRIITRKDLDSGTLGKGTNGALPGGGSTPTHLVGGVEGARPEPQPEPRNPPWERREPESGPNPRSQKGVGRSQEASPLTREPGPIDPILKTASRRLEEEGFSLGQFEELMAAVRANLEGGRDELEGVEEGWVRMGDIFDEVVREANATADAFMKKYVANTEYGEGPIRMEDKLEDARWHLKEPLPDRKAELQALLGGAYPSPPSPPPFHFPETNFSELYARVNEVRNKAMKEAQEEGGGAENAGGSGGGAGRFDNTVHWARELRRKEEEEEEEEERGVDVKGVIEGLEGVEVGGALQSDKPQNGAVSAPVPDVTSDESPSYVLPPLPPPAPLQSSLNETLNSGGGEGAVSRAENMKDWAAGLVRRTEEERATDGLVKRRGEEEEGEGEVVETAGMSEGGERGVEEGRGGGAGREGWEKVWTRDVQRKYEEETDPEIRATMKEMGADLGSWLTEEDIKNARAPSRGGPDSKSNLDSFVKRWQGKEREVGEEVMRKYGVQKGGGGGRREGDAWWMEKKTVVAFYLSRPGEASGGFFTVDMSRYLEGKEGAQKLPPEPRFHVVAVESEKDAIKVGRLLKEDSLYREFEVEELPIEPKRILKEAQEKDMLVSVFRRGQLAFTRGMTLEDLESQIITLEGPQYVDETHGANVIDIDYDKLFDDVESGKTGM